MIRGNAMLIKGREDGALGASYNRTTQPKDQPMSQPSQGEGMSPAKGAFYLSVVFSLWAYVMTLDYSAQKVSEEMTREQFAEIAKDRTRTLVACAQSRNIIVGDKLIECRAIDVPVREMDW